MKYTAEQRKIKQVYRLLALKRLNHLKDEVKADPSTWNDKDEDLKMARKYLFRSEAIESVLVDNKNLDLEKLDSRKRLIIEQLINGLTPARISKQNHIPIEEIYHVATVANLGLTPTFVWRLIAKDQSRNPIYLNDKRVLRVFLGATPGERLTDYNLDKRGYYIESGRFDWDLVKVGDLYSLSLRDGLKIKKENKFTA